MKKRKTSSRITIACAAAALAAILGMSTFLAEPVQAQERPTEATSISRFSDIEDGYDAAANDICYEIEAPAF